MIKFNQGDKVMALYYEGIFEICAINHKHNIYIIKDINNDVEHYVLGQNIRYIGKYPDYFKEL